MCDFKVFRKVIDRLNETASGKPNSEGGSVSCHYWRASLAFILLPQALFTLYAIVMFIKYRAGCGLVLEGLFLALIYPLLVPALSIYCAARELF